VSVAAARRLEPEWLDELPEHDARAQRSRRDLQRVNWIMGNAAILASRLPAGIARLAEVGAGDGAFALRLIGRMRAKPATVTLVDRQSSVARDTIAAFGRQGVAVESLRVDVFDWLKSTERPFDAIVANLFLHHFDDDALRRLLGLVAARTSCFVACEPRRSALALSGSRLLGLIGCNDVTRHDAVASVRAGFRDAELTALWPREGWLVEESPSRLFSHAFVARRA
jgi:2-polyprenyl-3-methyl-5-hydroxy-6-metoxy-1,4-benzoquinol methylase